MNDDRIRSGRGDGDYDRRDRDRRDRDDDRGRDHDDRDRRPKATSGVAIASLILGILACTCLSLLFLPGIVGIILGIIALAQISGGKVKGQGLAIAGLVLSILSIPAGLVLIALIFPAVQKVREASDRVATTINAKDTAIAFHRYHDQFQVLPMPDGGSDKPGQLSWRVGLLPYLAEPRQQDLYQQFDLNERWDSPKNQPLLDKRPKQYTSLLDPKPSKDKTLFQVFVGQGGLYPDRKTPIRLALIPDGTSNTMLFAESVDSVPWTKPEDMVVDERPENWVKPLPLPQRFVAAMCDGSIRFFDRTKVSDQTLRLMICPNDGTPLPFDAFAP